MELLASPWFIGMAAGMGLPGLMFVVWYFGQKAQDKALSAYREDTKDIAATLGKEILKLQENHRGEVLKLQMEHQKNVGEILAAYRADMAEQRRMYDNNIILVKDFNKLSADQQNVIILNTQAIQRLVDTLKFNRLCPNYKAEGAV